MIAVVDYGAGNQTSVARALARLGVPCVTSAESSVLESAGGVIFPGVGAAPQAMRRLAETGLDRTLKRLVEAGRPLFGICLGCQILLERSEEGDVPALGLLPGECVRFADNLREEDGSPCQIPHMGWNSLQQTRPSRLLEGIGPDMEFYFVHSYFVRPAAELVLATSHYGHDFCSLYGRDGLWAAQFHPEKSGEPGLRMLANFAACCGESPHA